MEKMEQTVIKNHYYSKLFDLQTNVTDIFNKSVVTEG